MKLLKDGEKINLAIIASIIKKKSYILQEFVNFKNNFNYKRDSWDQKRIYQIEPVTDRGQRSNKLVAQIYQEELNEMEKLK